MATAKQQPGVTKRDLIILQRSLQGFFEKGLKQFRDEVMKRLTDQDDKILGLRLDNRDLKQGQQEMIREQELVRDSLETLNDRVKYQKDMPERIEQLENDTHQLKREIHQIKVKMSK